MELNDDSFEFVTKLFPHIIELGCACVWGGRGGGGAVRLT